MQKSAILLIDSIINILIGVLLLFFPHAVIVSFGIPKVQTAFYPSMLGAILIGIGIALFFEWRGKESGVVGLGLGGAIIINICASLALSFWLLFGNLAIPFRGYCILWSLVVLILGVIIMEIKNIKRSRIFL